VSQFNGLLTQAVGGDKGLHSLLQAQRKELAHTLNAQVEIRNLLDDPSGGSIHANPRLALENLSGFQLGRLHPRVSVRFRLFASPISCRNESFELNLDKAYKMIRAPKNFRNVNNSDGIRFSAEYELKRNALHGTLKLSKTQPRHSCTIEQYAARLSTLESNCTAFKRKCSTEQITRILQKFKYFCCTLTLFHE